LEKKEHGFSEAAEASFNIVMIDDGTGRTRDVLLPEPIFIE